MSRSLPGFLSSSPAGHRQRAEPTADADAIEEIAASIAGYERADLDSFCTRMIGDAARCTGLDGGGAESTLLHAALVGLARGASRDAFLYASTRQIQGRPLIEHELASARLSAIAVAEATCDVQLGYLVHHDHGGERVPASEEAEREIRRASCLAITEAAHVHGGQGYVGDSAPRRRIEVANAVVARAELDGQGREG